MPTPLQAFRVDSAAVEIYPTKLEASVAAAAAGAAVLRQSIAERGAARVIVATGNSQQDMIASLAQLSEIDWTRVDVLHMDEYIGLPATHPASFRLWIKTRLVDKVHPRHVDYLNGDAADLEAERQRYEALIRSAPADLCFPGFGENGHIAFNDPHVADFNDPLAVKIVEMDAACRQQQVGEGHFPNLAAVPRQALTLTCPALMSARNWVCCVPEGRKAEAVRNALRGPISTACPASLARTHPHCTIFLDSESALLLSADT
jgi:glucosamine-6-phosphate deaminase